MSQATPDRLDRIENILEATAHQQAANTIAIAQLSAENKRFAAKCKAIIENAEADRTIILENQAAIRRISEYLLGQSGNGHSG